MKYRDRWKTPKMPAALSAAEIAEKEQEDAWFREARWPFFWAALGVLGFLGALTFCGN